jgi:zinc/manganese transport system substrate-binding protein
LITNLITVIRRSHVKPLALLAAAALLLTGCAATTPAADDTIRIVASTDVYGDLAQTIGGDTVTVTSLIAGASRDPHSFEASAQDQLAVNKADVVIENGGGYDPFVDTLLAASGSTATVISVAELVNLPEGTNEHLWYDFGAMDSFAKKLADTLAALDPENAAEYASNYETISAQLDGLTQKVTGLADGQGVAVTEPVPLYLLEAAGLVNRTPAGFTEAIEEGSDVPPAALQETLALFSDGAVALLAYNDQTASPETERVRAAAEAAGIPVVDFTETLPDGQTYLSWMTANIDALAAVL